MRAAFRPRAYVRVSGPDAEDFLQRMVSNDVEALAPGAACDALLLTAKARLIAPLRIWRRAPEDFLLLTEPDLGERVRAELRRFRFASKVEVELEEHTSAIVFGEPNGGLPTDDYGVAAAELLDAGLDPTVDEAELEALRVAAGTPAWGKELDDRVLPAEAGLDRTHISFSKGCYPGQEPIARLHYRGHANRGLRVLELDGAAAPGAEVRLGGKAVGRVTSVAGELALAYVRTEVPEGAELEVGDGRARAKKMPSR